MKSSLKQKVSLLGVVGALLMGGVTVGAAAPANAAPCGYYNNGLPRYNHCSSGNVKIRIDYIFGNRTQCVKPGITTLDIPAGNRVKNAYYIGKC